MELEKILGRDLVAKEMFSVSSPHCFVQLCLILLQENKPIQTPSTHRQRLASGNLPPPRIELANLPGNNVLGASVPQQRISPRQPLAGLSGNSPGLSGFAGYGMSAGLKVSNPAGSGGNGFARPAVRSRGRSTPGRSWVSY
jgi:E3 ubiquitin-protein ligase CCNP1IP1